MADWDQPSFDLDQGATRSNQASLIVTNTEDLFGARFSMLARVTLEVMVPLRIEHLAQLRGETLLEQLYAWIDQTRSLYDEKGRLIPWPEEMVAGGAPGAKIANAGFGIQRVAEGLAALAWVPDGGVDWAGMHWCRNHTRGRRLPTTFPAELCWQLDRDGADDDPVRDWAPPADWLRELCAGCGRRWTCECQTS